MAEASNDVIRVFALLDDNITQAEFLVPYSDSSSDMELAIADMLDQMNHELFYEGWSDEEFDELYDGSHVGDASEGAKERLRQARIEAKDEKQDFGVCAICLENMMSSSETEGFLIKMPECSHVFHEGCILKWLEMKRTCPLCRCCAGR